MLDLKFVTKSAHGSLNTIQLVIHSIVLDCVTMFNLQQLTTHTQNSVTLIHFLGSSVSMKQRQFESSQIPVIPSWIPCLLPCSLSQEKGSEWDRKGHDWVGRGKCIMRPFSSPVREGAPHPSSLPSSLSLPSPKSSL